MIEDTTQTETGTAPATAGETAAPSQDSKRTEKEKATFSLKKTAERLVELGGDPADVLGVKTHIETDPNDEDDKPVTVKMLRDIQKNDAHKTALELADAIEDEETRTNVKTYLSDRIKPSGNADEDFKFALSAASAGKNTQVLAEINRYTPPRRSAAGGSMPAHVEEEFIPTGEEAYVMKNFGVSKEKILEARKAHADKQK